MSISLKRIFVVFALCFALLMGVAPAAQAHPGHGSVTNHTTDDTVYYRYGTTNILTSVRPGSGSPSSYDVNRIEVAACYRLKFRQATATYTTGYQYVTGTNLGVPNDVTILVYDYERVC